MQLNKPDRTRGGIVLVCSLVIVFPLLKVFGGMVWLNGPTLTHITHVFGDIPWTLTLVRNSVSLAIWTVGVCMVPAVLLGFLLFRTRIPGRRVLILLMIVAAAVPMFVVSAAWTSIIGNDYWFSMETWYEKVLVGGFVQALAWMPWATVLSGLVFCANDVVHEESTLMDTGLASMFFRVSLPSAAKGLLAVSLLIAVFSLADVTVTDCIRLSTFQQECYTQFQLPDLSIVDENFDLLKPRRASTVALPYMALLVLAGSLLLPRMRADHSRSADGESRSPTVYSLPPATLAALTVVTWGVAATIFGFPVFRLLVTLGSWSTILTNLNASMRELGITLANALGAAVCATLLAFLWSAHAANSRLWRYVYGFFCLVLLTVPAPLVGISLITTLNTELMGWFYSSPAVYSYAYLLRFVPFAYLLIFPDVSRIPVEFHEESTLAGASYWAYITRIMLPVTWRSLSASVLLLFILGIGETGASFLVQSPGYTTLSVRFFTMIHSGMDAGVAALCIIVLLTTALPAGLFALVVWHKLSR